jgi:hypothetical protein
MSQFAAKLTDMFEAVEIAFREAAVARYREQAENAHSVWVKRLEGPEPKAEELAKLGRGYWRSTLGDLMAVPKYTKRTKPNDYVNTYSWEPLRKAIGEGHFAIDFSQAKADAHREVDAVKRHFVTKQTKKLTNATKLRKGVAKLEGTLVYNVVIIGQLVVTFANGDSFTLEMSITYNRSKLGKPFWQYPARFANVILNGKCPKSGVISEAWMGANFKAKK